MRINVVDRQGQAHELDAEVGDSMVQLLSFKHLVEATCGGECSCATCHVYIDTEWAGALPPPAGEEVVLLPELLNSQTNSRLACQLRMTSELDGLRLIVAPEQ